MGRGRDEAAQCPGKIKRGLQDAIDPSPKRRSSHGCTPVHLAKQSISLALRQHADPNKPTITGTEEDQLRAFFGDACAYCGRQLEKGWALDHIIPVDAGGTNGLGNRAPACSSCNGRKHTKPAEHVCADEVRLSRLRAWQALHPCLDFDRELLKQADEECLALYASWAERLKAARVTR